MSQDVDNQYIARTNAVAGCFSMFLLMFGLTFTPLFFPASQVLLAKGLLFPLLFMLEFVVLVPLYYFFFRKRDGLGKGIFSVRRFTFLFVGLLIIQLILPWFLGLRQTEAWVTSQVSLNSYALWLSTLTLVFIAPVYEEIVFRGCLFNAFQYWFNNKTWLSSVVVSVIFAVMHTQYVDLRTLLMLFLVSQVLILARLKSNGLLMPITLHIAMNGTVIALQMAAQTL
ncbi:CPBP family intramembrane glutamic endopeptidase [Citrobacter youngae]|uniref:CAAX amino terminal protease family protein n=1 Tax=Citrobacter youngae ATCC 29220 TaxID=500640 RepID=D4B9T3_9ENTR|nr:CPBP family intramembrane glutamic endopeptidase [Citrobacter youngae]EFE08944.1 CAAX amino terminal protease family protein [Citrobacter youngae ATCC 29220]